MPRLVLAGGGHAQLSVLHALAQHRPDVETVLVTPEPYQIYSGMLPGWMAGHYSLPQCRIDLRPLARRAGVELVAGRVAGMDANRRCVVLADGSRIDYDLLSVDVGGESDLSALEAMGERLLPVRPIGAFVQRWQQTLSEAIRRRHFRLAVVGAGAAGVELALAAQYALNLRVRNAEVVLIASESGVLPGHAHGVSETIRTLLQQRGIVLHQAHAVGTEDGLLLGNGQHLSADLVIAATGSSPPQWLRTSQLELNQHGYLAVDATQRSLSHRNVFAAGDVCARTDTIMARSGVHAVFAGPVVAHNLIATLTGGKLIRYRPRRRSLYLLATGPRHAVASWGKFSAAGHWVWRWKDWIDRRFMNRHQMEAASVNEFPQPAVLPGAPDD